MRTFKADPRFRSGMDVYVVGPNDEEIEVWTLYGQCSSTNPLWIARKGQRTEPILETYMSVTRAEALLLLSARYLKEGQEAFRKHKHYRAEARKLLGIPNDRPG